MTQHDGFLLFQLTAKVLDFQSALPLHLVKFLMEIRDFQVFSLYDPVCFVVVYCGLEAVLRGVRAVVRVLGMHQAVVLVHSWCFAIVTFLVVCGEGESWHICCVPKGQD